MFLLHKMLVFLNFGRCGNHFLVSPTYLPTYPSGTRHLSPTLLVTQILPPTVASLFREGCISCPRSQAAEVLGKSCESCVSEEAPHSHLVTKGWSQVVGHFSPTYTSLLRSPTSTGLPFNMARMLLLIFIMVHPGDRAFSQDPEGCGAGERGYGGGCT